MFRANITLFKVFLFVIFRIISGDDFRDCVSDPCVKMSECESLNYNYTSLTESELEYYRESMECNTTDVRNDPMVCCSRYTNETDKINAMICGKAQDSDKIMGGNDTDITEFPWMALLEYNSTTSSGGIFLCAGSLINNRYILTAAHCLKRELIRVHLGKYYSNQTDNCIDSDCGHPTVIVDIESKIVHPDYNNQDNGLSNDIGLIRLSRTVSYTEYIQPICLSNLTSSGAENPYISGWGKGALSSAKQKLSVPEFTGIQRYCANIYLRRYGKHLNESIQICAGGERGRGTCGGDSGGPLMIKQANEGNVKVYTILGIVASGYDICGLTENNDTNYPILFTLVSSYRSWIEEEVTKGDN